MGRQAFAIGGAIVGAGVGFVVGGPTGAFYGAQYGLTVGAIAGSYIDPIVLQGNKIGDTQLQTASEGGARAIVFGRGCVNATCIIARGNRQVIKKKTSNGKGSTGSTVNETVTWTFAIGIGEALVGSSICRIWQDETLVYDVLGDGAISSDDNQKFAAKFRFYDGNEEQLPDADLQVFLGEDTPYFRGTAYAVFPNFDLTQTAERIPIFKFEILNGVSGIVDELETLAWSLPNSGVHTSSQSVTLTGDSGTTYGVDMFFTTDMEARLYSDHVVAVGGGGRFITAASNAATDTPGNNWSISNIYQVTISDPSQTYYVNMALPGETAGDSVHADGTDAYKLSVTCSGNATLTFSATDVEGASGYYPQSGSVRAEVTGIVEGGAIKITLASVVDRLLKLSGGVSSDYSVDTLDDILIAGVVIEQTVNGNDAVNAITAAYFVDPCEVNGVLQWVKRGGDIVRTLTADDLTDEPDVQSRENVIEYPEKLSFFYQSPQTGYASTKATSYRYSPQVDSSSEGSTTSPVTFYDSNEPAQIAQKLHKVMWTEAEGSFGWTVGPHCIDLVPTDVVALVLRGQSTRARVTSIENDGSSIKLSMIKDRQSNYTSTVTGIPLPLPTPPQPTTMSKAVLAVLDLPALQDSDDQLVYYTAMSGSTATWNGGQLERSLDGGATWSVIQEVTTASTMGRLTTAVSAADREYTDTSNVLTVQLFDPDEELHSQSDTTFLQEQGAVAVALADGSYEVLQYRDAVDMGAGLYQLSYLQRGRLDTVAGAHAVGALFVLLDTNVSKQTGQTAWLGGVMKHRGVSYGESAEDADVVTNTYVGRSQIEWSPASATVEWDGTTNVAVTDIVPRYRFGTEVNPIPSANMTGFRVTATNGSTTVTSDITSGSAYLTLSGGSPTSVSIAALNKLTGPGQPLTITTYTQVDPGTLTPEAIINAGGGA